MITMLRDGQVKKCTLFLFQILFKTPSGASISKDDYGGWFLFFVFSPEAWTHFKALTKSAIKLGFKS